MPEFVETQHFFLDLPALAEALGEWLDGREATGHLAAERDPFQQNILEEIRPRAMTRDIDWGIAGAARRLDATDPTKRLYVWFDAVIGYLSASIEWARRSGDAGAPGGEWWNDPEALSYYFMGKDNIIFHSQIWPAELLAYNGKGARAGAGARVRRAQPAHRGGLQSEFLTMEGKKFSSASAP